MNPRKYQQNQTKLTQLQAINKDTVTAFNIDKQSRMNLDRCHHLIEKLFDMRVSNSVLIRFAIWQLRLFFMEEAYKIQTTSKSKEEALERVLNFVQSCKQALKNAAEGRFFEDEGDF